VFIVPAADILVVMRLYALYNRSRKVGAVLVFLWLVEIGFLAGFIAFSFKSTTVMANPLPGILPGCFPSGSIEVTFIIKGGAIAIVIQAIYLGLALNVLLRRVRTAMTPFLQVFFRDGALYCSV